jgi:hypothetical protein
VRRELDYVRLTVNGKDFIVRTALKGEDLLGRFIPVYLAAQRFGGAWVLQELWKQLAVDQVFNKLLKARKFQSPVERAIFALVANRALAPMSERAVEEWVKPGCISARLAGYPAPPPVPGPGLFTGGPGAPAVRFSVRLATCLTWRWIFYTLAPPPPTSRSRLTMAKV